MRSPATYADVLDHARGLLGSLPRPPVVAIAGHGGAGKTTLTRRLADDLGVEWQQVVRLDRMYAATDTSRAGLWDLQDWPTVLAVLAAVREDPVPERLAYLSRQYDGSEDRIDVPMPPVVLVEGIRLLRPETLPLLDLAVWIDLDPERAGLRAQARNVLQGDGRDELDLWDSKWVPEGHDYQRLVRPELLAHLVVTAAGTI